ncbi:MAG TPA: hypothetical protein VE553_07670 [Candidatus Binatia bacterium]|nr:hypothetical protein [Candidatus Binatia bacterium]
MSAKWLRAVAVLLAGLGLAFAGSRLLSKAVQVSAAPAAVTQDPEPPRRERDADDQSPTISFIDNPTATCYRAIPESGACYVTWNNLQVTASASQYIITMTVAIDNQMVAYHAGFFQTTIYVPGAIYGPGFRVSCGLPGAGGRPDWGTMHSYTIRARETGGLKAANYGSVICPADTAHSFMPVVFKR